MKLWRSCDAVSRVWVPEMKCEDVRLREGRGAERNAAISSNDHHDRNQP